MVFGWGKLKLEKGTKLWKGQMDKGKTCLIKNIYDVYIKQAEVLFDLYGNIKTKMIQNTYMIYLDLIL